MLYARENTVSHACSTTPLPPHTQYINVVHVVNNIDFQSFLLELVQSFITQFLKKYSFTTSLHVSIHKNAIDRT